MHENLDALEILKTTRRLEQRIEESFPGASLALAAQRLGAIGRESISEVEALRRPLIALRGGVGLLLVGAVVVLAVLVPELRVNLEMQALSELLESIEAALGSLFFLGAGVAFLVTLEGRLKRKRALHMLHKLRTLAHIVDMHQLTKDPDAVRRGPSTTASSPPRGMTDIQLEKYLKYAGDLLALVGKVAALYAESFADPVVLGAVDDIEDLTSGLGRKIWQKISILEQIQRHGESGWDEEHSA